jgi:ribosomal protein L37AE/L43A
MGQIVTSDKSVIFGYRRKSTMQESQPAEIYCPWCGKLKKQVGRIWFCLNCKNARFSSGKPISKIPLKTLARNIQKSA